MSRGDARQLSYSAKTKRGELRQILQSCQSHSGSLS